MSVLPAQDRYFTIRISHDQVAQLKRLAAENDRSVSAEVRRAIKQYLERQPAV